MSRNPGANRRTAILAAAACALFVAACGGSPPALTAVSNRQSQVQQTASTRQAYSLMVAQERKGHGQGQGQDAGAGTTSTGTTTSAGGNTSGGGGTAGGSGTPSVGATDPQAIRHCDPVRLGSTPTSPQLAGTVVTLNAVAANCPNALFEFWFKAPSHDWSVLQTFDEKSTATWKTAGLHAGAYSFDVWAKKPGSAEGDFLHISPLVAYTITAPVVPPAPDPCTSVTWNKPSPASPQPPGTTVVLSGSAEGCPSALYEFWVRNSSSTTWTVLQAWSPSSTASWDTTSLAAGTYLFDIWAKHSASAPTWEAHISPNPTYALQPGAPCTTVSWNTPAPAQPQAPGAQVTLGGVASGCPNPQYEFWVQAPGSTTWTILQAYSASSTAVWDTTGLVTGTYLFDIWARQLGSSASWEAHISPNPTDTLEMGPACTSSSLTFNPSSPATHGAPVTLTATSAGCPNPVYEFWVQAPGGAWTILQAYSSTSTVTWSTGGLAPGTYLFDVWVKDAGNSPAWEAHISPNPTFTLS